VASTACTLHHTLQQRTQFLSLCSHDPSSHSPFSNYDLAKFDVPILTRTIWQHKTTFTPQDIKHMLYFKLNTVLIFNLSMFPLTGCYYDAFLFVESVEWRSSVFVGCILRPFWVCFDAEGLADLRRTWTGYECVPTGIVFE
jgi:hypothetical protein